VAKAIDTCPVENYYIIKDKVSNDDIEYEDGEKV